MTRSLRSVFLAVAAALALLTSALPADAASGDTLTWAVHISLASQMDYVRQPPAPRYDAAEARKLLAYSAPYEDLKVKEK